MKNRVELLSPAGSWDALVAAVQNGADAVYIGGKRFNARQNASNFDDEILEKAVDYAHLYGVRIYITMNTLIKEKELKEAQNFLSFICQLGVDGVIVQDLGISKLIRGRFPQLDIHASTQMTVHNLEGVRLLEKMGFKRVVLARELSIEEIKYISEHTTIELETFIHGALCVSYSGQCLMSSILGGRSGNRGMCAQPCRLPYEIVDIKYSNKVGYPRYLLNTKDLSTYSFLPEILKAGVSSLKIEGRMKRPEYVAVVTGEYRKMLDMTLQGNNLREGLNGEKELKKIFNRGGFSRGYYYGTENRDMMYPERSGHTGFFLGKVFNVRNNQIHIALNDEIETGDVIQLQLIDGNVIEQKVINFKKNDNLIDRAYAGDIITIVGKKNIKQGTDVWKITGIQQYKKAQATFMQDPIRRIPISASGLFISDKPPVISFHDEDGFIGMAKAPEAIEKALNKPLTKDVIKSQLMKLGDTPFALTSIDLNVDDGLYAPVSLINQLRRQAIDDLINKRTQGFKRVCSPVVIDLTEPFDINAHIPIESNLPGMAIYVDELMDDFLEFEGIQRIGYMPKKWPLDMRKISRIIDGLREKNITVRLVLPRIIRQKESEFLNSIDKAFWSFFDEYQAGNIGTLKFLKEKSDKRIIGDYFLNITNSLSISQLIQIGIDGVVLSPELTIGEIHDIIEHSNISSEILIFGDIPVMIMEHCPVGKRHKDCHSCALEQKIALRDRKGMVFPMVRRGICRCYTEVLNSNTLFVADEIHRLNSLKVDTYGLLLHGKSKEYITQIIALHRYALEHTNTDFPNQLQRVVDEIKSKGFTRGHFFRGIE